MRAQGVTRFSQNAGMRRDNLYRFNGESSPTFDRVIDVLQGLNMHLMVKPRK